MLIHQVVHVLPDKTEQVLLTTEKQTEVDFLLLSPRWLGTWITDTRKLLRYNMGEIHLRQKNLARHISNTDMTAERCVLKLENDYAVGWIVVTADCFTAFDDSMQKVLWTADSPAILSIRLDSKELAFECMEVYNNYLDAYSLEGAI